MKIEIYRKEAAPHSTDWYCSKRLLFKVCIIFQMISWNIKLLTGQVLSRKLSGLGLKKSDKVPDSKTFWLFREQLIEKEVILGLFKIFNEALDAAGVLSNQGKMVDAPEYSG